LNLTTCFIVFCASHIRGAGNAYNAQSSLKKLQSRRGDTHRALGLGGHFEGRRATAAVGWFRVEETTAICSRLSRTQARRSSSCSGLSREQSSDETKIQTSLSRACHPIRSWCWPCAASRPCPDERQICLTARLVYDPVCTDINVTLTIYGDALINQFPE
jgi:hypothetical protein